MESLRTFSIFFIALFYTVISNTAGAAVGVTPGVGAVTDRGAATYTIPLNLPDDRMTPNLAISYDHTRGDGLLGIGFAISGFSTIQRCNKTWHEGGRSVPDLLADDMYCLDGQKLRLTSGNWGQPNSTYQTELETFARVTALGTTDGGGGLQGGPERWEVWTRDGLIHEYGFTSDSRILSVGSNVYRAWALNRIRDRVGNYIDFSYTIDTANGSYRPNQITYSGNTMQGVQPSTRVLFVYETANRPDPIYLYRYGDDSPSAGLIVEFRRLDRIEIVSIPSSTVLRKYEISYETAGTTGRSRMSSLQECAGADCLASTTFQWINGTAGFWPESSPGVTVPAPSNGALVVDFDNDGQQDLLYSSSTTSGTGSWRVSKGSNTGPTASVDTGAANWNYANAQTMEWSGDGATDLLVPCSNGTTWCIFHARTGTPPNQVFSPTPLNTGISTSGSGTSVSGDWLAADIDGNGRSDLLRIATNPTGGRDVFVRLGMPQGGGFTGEDHFYLGTQNLSFTPFLAAKKLTTLKRFDIDGDGAEDIYFQESGNGVHTVHISFSIGRRADFFFHQGQEFLYMGDFNGDGLSDLAYAGANWFIRHSNGGGFAPTPLAGPSAANLVRAFVADYDGDGKSDILMATSTSPNWLVARSTGNGLAAFVDTGLSSAGTAMVAPADFDGDGLKDFIRVDSSAGNAVKYVKKRQNVPDLLDRVTDGYGNFVDFGYLSTGLDDSSYVKGAGLWPLQPARDFNDPMIVVKMMQANDGIGGTYTEGHFYTGGAFDLDGRDFVGFKKHERTDTRDQSTVIETYNQVFPFIGTLASRRLENLGHLLKQETFTWSSIHFDPDVPNPNGVNITVRKFPYLATRVEDLRDRVGAAEPEVSRTTTTNVFDSWGTLTDSTVQTQEFFTGLQNGAVHTRRVWHPVVLNDTTNWCLGKPSETEFIASSSLPSGATLTRTAAQSWDSFYCRLTSETVEPGDPNWQAATSYSYDDFGNINGITATPATGHNQLPRTTTLSWGTTGRFLSSITNPLSQTLSLGWDPALGVRTSVTDANSLTANWHYDAFGRVTSVDNVDGTATSLNRSVCNTSACQSGNTNIRILLEQVALDTADQEITRARFYLDQHGRTLVKQVKLLDDSFSNVTVSYNARGLVSQYSMPFTSSAAATYTTVTYDFRGRPTLIRRPTSAGDPTNHDTQFAYEGLKTVRTDALGKIRTTYSDAIGRVIRSIDALSSVVDYEYDAFDDLVKTRDPLGSESVFGYNVRGFKVSSTDPDMGPWQYDYYPLGEARSVTDAKGQTTTFTYDKLSRPTTRTMPEGTTGSIVSTFTWGTSATAKNIGRLEWEEIAGTGVTTYRETYTYDPTGRPSRVTYREGVTDYFVDYAYNSTTGLLETITYPTSTASFRMPVTYTYHNGLPSRVTSSSTVWWTAGTNNALGQLTSEILGDAAAGVTVETLSSYDSVTGRLGSRVATYDSGTVAGTVLTNLGIQYDRIGNVIQRQENQQGLTENFYYDDLYRLDSSTLGATTTDYGYDVRGNITSKSGVGTTYSYTATVAGCTYYPHPQIHAVRQITGGSSTQNFCYDANGNMTNRNGTSLTWFANNLSKSITKDASNSSTFEYAPSGQRWRHVYRTAGSNYTHTYIGNLVEKVVGPTTTDWKHYVYVNGEAIGMYIRRSNGAKSTHYFVQDALGGIAAINQSNASFTMRESFDAFGKRRGQNWTGVPSATDLTRMNDTTRRGFTFHEHLDSTGLVHMNGRVYDPAIGRFVSADPFIQAPLFSQSLNRYSYLFNNPLSGSDPTGFMGPGFEDETGGGGSFGQPDTPPPLWNDPIYIGQVSEFWLAGWSVGMAQEYLLNLNLPPLDLSNLDLSGLDLGNLNIPPINVPPINLPPIDVSPTTPDPASPTDPPGGQPPDPTPGPTSIVESSPASTVSGMQNCVFTAGAVTCGVRNEPWTEAELRSGASLLVGFTAAGTLADICTAASGEDCITGEKVGWFWRLAGVVPFTSELRKGGKIIDAALDASGKVHGRLPLVEDLARYSVDDLTRLRDQLQISVQTRIRKTVELGADYGHDARIVNEQQLLQSIETHLKDR